MNITILASSPRQHSLTLRLAKGISHLLLQQQYLCKIIDFADSNITLSNQSPLQTDSLFQQRLIQALEGPGLVFFLTPEYNWLPSAESINFINRFADKPYASLFDQKVFALAGVSSGRGGRMPCVTLGTAINKIIGFMGLQSMVSGSMFEAQFAGKVMDTDGTLLDNDAFNKGLEKFIKQNIQFAHKWTSSGQCL
jgi:chromate reductase, NAD(P)H dehydrogenase (quinone)